MQNEMRLSTRTVWYYNKTYVEQLFTESEINRLLKAHQSRLIIKNVREDIYPDFAIEYTAEQLGRAIDTSHKKSVVQTLLANDGKYRARWHGNTRLFAVQDIVKELGGNIIKLVDYKKRSNKASYTNNMVNGLYKNAKFTAEEEKETESLQMFAGF